ncbi:MAG TPA: hypothetical protein VML54_14665 [Candidatus Limnocylindrales bacterium]|nr:hypothetical protein [Candidatus Limnocylindrales bacterium]
MLGLVGIGGAAGASFSLTEAEQAAAIAFGAESVDSEDLGREWKVTGNQGEVTVMTPFHRLALAARQAAYKKTTLRPREIQGLVRDGRERVVLWVSLQGPRVDFARHFAPTLSVGGNVVLPSLVQNEHTALAQPDGRFLARCVYSFPTRGVPPTAPVVLVVRGGQAEVARFTLDLASMR